jgi:UDP-N-acetylmuramoyl-tripeptide--D-alanyl-D-alanine ligase
LLALAVADQLGVDSASLNAMEVSVPGGRNRRLVQGGLTLLDETYNASPEAVMAALTLLSSQPGRRFAVLGTMLELGAQSLQLHADVATQAAALKLDGLVVVDGGAEGRAMANAAAGFAPSRCGVFSGGRCKTFKGMAQGRGCGVAEGQPRCGA